MSSLLYFINAFPFNSEIFLSSTITSPDVTWSIPPNIFKAVVFPAPLGPTITTNSPFSIEKLVLFNAFIIISPILYSLHTFLNSIYAIIFTSFEYYIFIKFNYPYIQIITYLEKKLK